MLTDGLSLAGFMDQTLALGHFRTQCKQPDNSDAALIAVWNQAKSMLGKPVKNAGLPDIQQLTPTQLQGLVSQPTLATVLTAFPGSSFALVEISPLLAFQFAIDKDRSAHHCQNINAASNFDDLASICLPTAQISEPVQQIRQDQSALIKSRSLNMQMGLRGIFSDANNSPNAMGFQIGMALPLAHVVRLNGKCYLHNGFHRALGLGLAGISHMPCLFRDVPDALSAGIRAPDVTFQLALLESTDPPTLAHFIRGSTLGVKLKAACRVLHISWAEYVVYDD